MSGRHSKIERRRIRRLRIRRRIACVPDRPRLSVFRSAKHIYAQVVDDLAGKTLVAASSRESTTAPPEGKGKIGVSFEVGKTLGERAREKGISKVAFDRGGCKYHGRVKALAEGARKEGLKF